MATTDVKDPLVRASDLGVEKEEVMHHPLNPLSEIRGHSLSERAGLTRLGLHLLRVPPGKESFVYHSHQGEEEFIYILAGRGVAEIDEREVEVGPGDFMGFPAPSVGHHLRNPFSEDLVYLSGGERRALEVADYPRLRKRLIRSGGEGHVVDWDQQKKIW